MSNKRRKSIGGAKIARNLAVRIRRGAVRLGNPMPGHGRWRDAWLEAIAEESDSGVRYVDRDGRVLVDRARVETQTTNVRDHYSKHTDDYWRGR